MHGQCLKMGECVEWPDQGSVSWELSRDDFGVSARKRDQGTVRTPHFGDT